MGQGIEDSECVAPQTLGVPTISRSVCRLSFDECTYLLVLLLKLGGWVGVGL